MERAATFEHDRDKVKRQFKVNKMPAFIQHCLDLVENNTSDSEK